MLPARALAGGFLSSRASFLIGVTGAVAAGITGSLGEATFLHVKPPATADRLHGAGIESLSLRANPVFEPGDLQEVLSRSADPPAAFPPAFPLVLPGRDLPGTRSIVEPTLAPFPLTDRRAMESGPRNSIRPIGQQRRARTIFQHDRQPPLQQLGAAHPDRFG